MSKPIRYFAGWVAVVFLFAGCAVSPAVRPSAVPPSSAAPKKIILVICDGMGPQEVGLLTSYARQAPRSVLKGRTTAFDRMMNAGGRLALSMTYPGTGLVVDSAASATQLATGKPAGSEMVGMDRDGNIVESLIEKAKKAGKATGIVSDTRLTHATPAGFGAHEDQRDNENEIAADMLALQPDVMLSGGLRYFIPKDAAKADSAAARAVRALTGGAVRFSSGRNDDLDLLKEAADKGYALAFNAVQLERASGSKILGLFAESALPYAIDADDIFRASGRTVPTLRDMAAKTLEVLSRNEKGFVLMLEAGLLDWMLHDNDAGGALQEMVMLNGVLEYVLGWAGERGDTLVVITGDHETGGFGFSYSAFDLPAGRPLPGDGFKGKEFKPLFNYGRPETLDRLYDQKISFESIFRGRFDALPKEERTPAALARIVNEAGDFKITDEAAARILETEANPFYVEKHRYLGNAVVPRVRDFASFYVYQSDNRKNLLGRELSKEQSVVWSTGTHTATPIPVFSFGPASGEFQGIIHHTEIGRKLMSLIRN